MARTVKETSALRTSDVKKLNKELEQQDKILASIDGRTKEAQQAAQKRYEIEQKLAGVEGQRAGLGKAINDISKGVSGNLLKQLKQTKAIDALEAARQTGNKKIAKQAENFAKTLSEVATGQKDLAGVYKDLENTDFGDFEGQIKNIIKTLKDSPDLTDKLSVEAEAQQKINDFQKSVTDITDMLSSPKAMGVAVIGLVAKLATDFATQALEVRKELGTSAADSARLAGNMQIASFQARLLGGDTQAAAQAVTSLTREFGSLDAVSSNVARQAGSITAQFGIGGENLGKLTKQMSVLNGGSIETNLNTLETVGNLARAERVAPADVLNDMAENTETFAKFSMQGGKNLAKAAIEARKLGLNLQAVDKISESILDIEGSIEKQMEASVLLGRQLNLDKARELALSGDLEGVLAEVKNQVGGTEALSRMNVVQRKALADAVGLEVSELSKLAAGEKAVNEAQEARNKVLHRNMLIGAAIGGTLLGVAMALKAVATGGFSLFKDGAVAAKAGLTGVGIGGAIGGAAGAMVPRAQTGGVVRETGMAVVHKGESIAGTQFGGRESNNLLKELIKQNSTLMGRLTNKVGDLALSS